MRIHVYDERVRSIFLLMKMAEVATSSKGRTTHAASGIRGATPFSSVFINKKSAPLEPNVVV
jgi:hypothetical protein